MLITNFTTLNVSNWIDFFDSEAVLQFLREIYFHDIVQLYLPWVCVIIVGIVMSKMVTGVRARKEGIVMVALFVQLFMPVPCVESSPKIEQVEVKKHKKKLSGEFQ